MNVKLTAQQKSKPIYTATDVYSIMQPILLRENKQRRKQEYFWVMRIDDERYLQFVELLAHALPSCLRQAGYGLTGLGGQNRVHIKPALPVGRPAEACLTDGQTFSIAIQKQA
jgi:hypothetical protein